MGGGGKDRQLRAVFEEFVKLAGGKKAKIVVVPTAASSNPKFTYQRSATLRLAEVLELRLSLLAKKIKWWPLRNGGVLKRLLPVSGRSYLRAFEHAITRRFVMVGLLQGKQEF